MIDIVTTSSPQSRIMYLDIETDGYGTLNPPKQKILQLGYIIDDKEVSIFNSDIEKVNTLVVPHKYSSPIYLKIKGVTFDDMMDRFYSDLVSCKYICAHNSQFDLGCIKNELNSREYSSKIIEEIDRKIVIDTMILSTPICRLKGRFGYKWPKLEELYIYCFGEKPDLILHDALNDCRVMKLSLEYLIYKGLVDIPKN